MDRLLTFVGSYYGITATDESPTRYGELEIRITEKNLELRAATGLTIRNESIAIDQLKDVTKEEDEKEYYNVFRVAESEVELVFILNPEFTCPDLLVRGSIGDYVHPTFLFNKKRFLAILWFKLSAIWGKEVPRLSHGKEHTSKTMKTKSA